MRTQWRWLLLLGSMGCAGVGPAHVEVDSGVAADTGHPGPAVVEAGLPETLDAPPSPVDASGQPVAPVRFLVYAHTADKLYTVDPETLTVTLIGTFMRPGAVTDQFFGPIAITDIAVNHMGGIVGISESEVLSIDARTAQCTHLADSLGYHGYNGLSWVQTATDEILLASGSDGTVWRIDPTTGASTSVGTMGAGMSSSGDLVSVNKFGTLATIKRAGMSNDWLARLDPATGAATPIGDIGFTNVWGIGFWKDRVFGFCESGQFILIDPDTGKGTLSQTLTDQHWWGAGV